MNVRKHNKLVRSLLPENMGYCGSCKMIKHIDDFNTDNTEYGFSTNHLRKRCKSCDAIESAKPLNVHSRVIRNRVKKYGITEIEYIQLCEQQDWRCAICGTNSNLRKGIETGLCVDHNHDTGVIRGALCHSCNSGLGLFKDNVHNLQNAINYLSRYSNEALRRL